MITFNPSEAFTIGAEIEVQIINRDGFDLIGVADDLINKLQIDSYGEKIKPEITQSMLEINSEVHNSPKKLLVELNETRDFIVNKLDDLNIYLTGGGTHPFQMWNDRKIYPKKHYKQAADKYGYLAKMFTVFGLHVHVGCVDGDQALYLMNSLARYLPQFIALSASSPFCQGVDTEFDSCRSNIVNSFPLSGLPKIVDKWENFCLYFENIKELKIAEKIDNFYWDLRPKPNYGTVEVRVCDAPLTMERVVMIAAYIQTLAYYILTEKPFKIFTNDYLFYRYNRFQASRYGFAGVCINPHNKEKKLISEDILATVSLLEPSAKKLGNQQFLAEIADIVTKEQNDAKWLRQHFVNGETLEKIVYLQSQLWEGRINYGDVNNLSN